MRRILALIAAFVVITPLPAPALAASADGYTKNVAVVIWDGLEVLDFAGPAEVFAAAGSQGAFGGRPAFNVYTVSRSKTPIVSQGLSARVLACS